MAHAWVGTGYLLATRGVHLIFGRLGDMFGRKPAMLVSCLSLALGTIACGLAQSMTQLIVFRTLQRGRRGHDDRHHVLAPADLFSRCQAAGALNGVGVGRVAMASGIRPKCWAARRPGRWDGVRHSSFHIAAAGAFFCWRALPAHPPHARWQPQGSDWVGAILLVLAVGAPLAAGTKPGSGHAHPVGRPVGGDWRGRHRHPDSLNAA